MRDNGYREIPFPRYYPPSYIISRMARMVYRYRGEVVQVPMARPVYYLGERVDGKYRAMCIVRAVILRVDGAF